MKHQCASRNNQETNNADSSDSEDPDNLQPVLNIEDRGRNREFLTGALRTDEGWQNSNRSSEENHDRGQNRHESEDRAGHLQQPVSFQNNSQASPTMSHRYTPQKSQQPLNNCTGPDGHYNNGYNNNLFNGFPSFPSSPPDWMQHQALMIQNTMSLPKTSIDNFIGDPLKCHQLFSFFKATIHNNSGLPDAKKRPTCKTP